MKRTAHSLTMLGVVSGLALAALPGTAVAGPLSPPGCVVQHVDERGGVTGTSIAREGTVSGRFLCTAGQWELTRSPFDRGDSIVSREIQIDRAGNASTRQIVGPALSYRLTLAEMSRLAQAFTGQAVTFGKAIVAVNDGRQRTQEEVRALLAGQDRTGVRVLGVIDRLDPAMSLDDIVGGVGGTPEGTVVYFSIWGAIKSAFAWVVDTIHEIGDWIEEHCRWVPALPPDIGFDFTCHF